MLKHLLQHHSSKALVVQRSAFFIVQLSHPYITTQKPMALTRQTFVSKVISLLFNTIKVSYSFPVWKGSSYNFMATVTIHSEFRAQEEESSHCFHLFPFYLPSSDGTRCHDLQFSSVTQSCLTLCDPMDCSTPCLSVHHQLPEFA